MKRGIIFTAEVLILLLVVAITLQSLYMRYTPARKLELQRVALDSLSVMKITGMLQSMDESDMRNFLDEYFTNWRLNVTVYDPKDLSVDQNFVIGRAPDLESSTASISFISGDKFGKADLEVWD